MINITDEQEVITLKEVAESIGKDDEAENKLLNSEIAKQCTHSKGYISQTVYLCLSCKEVFNKVAGICYGCALSCHPKHTIVDLGVKRHFRCDCGTPRINNQCKLTEKSEDNSNSYNQNYSGKFCNCHCAFDQNDCQDMVQCLFCSDWFHESHVHIQEGNENDKEVDEMEFICQDCANKDAICPYILKWAQENLKNKSDILLEPTPKKVVLEECNAPVVSQCKKPILKGEWKCDYFIPNGWYDSLICKCESCKALLDPYYLTEPLDAIYEDLMSFGDFTMLQERKQNLNIISSLPALQKQKLSLMLSSFMAKAAELAKTKGKDPINSDDIKSIFASMLKQD